MRLASPFVIEERQLWTNPNGNREATNQIVIHHAAANYRPGRAVADIYAYHSKKWPDYHAAAYAEILQIEADGQSIGCHLMYRSDQIGAGVYGRNADTFHICAATNFIAIPDDTWIEALAQRAAAAKRRYPRAEIVGHKDIALKGYSTTCPGQLWSAWKTRLLVRVDALLKQDTQKPVAQFVFPGLPVYRDSLLIGDIACHLPEGAMIEIDASGLPTYAKYAGHVKRATFGATVLEQPGFVDMRLLA